GDPLSHDRQLRQRRPEGTGHDVRRPGQASAAQGHHELHVQVAERSGRDRFQDPAQRRPVARGSVRAHPDRRDDVRRRGIAQPHPEAHGDHQQHEAVDRRGKARLRRRQHRRRGLRLLPRRCRLREAHQGL
ncbi:MAG: hypothetical protein AVDCRST_MAG06-1893, partial [uncultured Nocardioides sp.]